MHLLALVASLALPIGFAADILRDLGGSTPPFLFRVGCPFFAKRKVAPPWLEGFALAKGAPRPQALPPHGSPGLPPAPVVPIGAFAIAVPAFLLSALWASPLAWRLPEAVWWGGMGFAPLGWDLGAGLAAKALVVVASLGTNWRKGQNPYPKFTGSALKTSHSPAPAVWFKKAFAPLRFGVEKTARIGGVGGTRDKAVYLTEGGTGAATHSKAHFIPGREQAGWLAPVRSRAHLQVGLTPSQGGLPQGHPDFLSPEGKPGTWFVPFIYKRSQTSYGTVVRSLMRGGTW